MHVWATLHNYTEFFFLLKRLIQSSFIMLWGQAATDSLTTAARNRVGARGPLAGTKQSVVGWQLDTTSPWFPSFSVLRLTPRWRIVAAPAAPAGSPPSSAVLPLLRLAGLRDFWFEEVIARFEIPPAGSFFPFQSQAC